MKATGIVRRIDDLGRVVIPKEIRRTLRIREGDPLEIYTEKDGEVIFKKYSPMGELSGFAGQIVLMVGVNADKTVSGISVVTHAETPGLGAVAADKTAAGEAFRNSFAGHSGSLTVGDIDALTGATITSRAICVGVNAALDCVAGLG